MAEVLRQGLLPASFIPPKAQRHRRDLTRYRTPLIEARARLVNRLPAVLEEATSKLASVVTAVRGVCARAILEALVAGETDAQVLAEWARGRLRTKRALLAQAVVGPFRAQQAFLITEHLSHLDTLDEALERLGAEIGQRWQEELQAIELLDTLPGVRRKAAQIILAEIGTTLDRFPDAKHLACLGRNLPRPCPEWRQTLQGQDPQRHRLAPAGPDREGAGRVQHQAYVSGLPVPADGGQAWQATRAGGAGADDSCHRLPDPNQARTLSGARRRLFR